MLQWFILWIDAVGRLLDELDRLGLVKALLSFYRSDNGGNMYNG
jgi:hypothetical protein